MDTNSGETIQNHLVIIKNNKEKRKETA